MVDGELAELSPEVLAKLRGEIDAPAAYHPDRMIQASVDKRHREKTEAQAGLRAAMMQWAACKTDIPRAQREFYIEFGIDVLSAQALGRADAETLRKRIIQ